MELKGPSTTLEILENCTGTLSGSHASLTSSELLNSCATLVSSLASLDTAGRPICYIAPPGADGAVAFLATSIAGIAAPMHSRSTPAEIVGYARALNAAAIVGPTEVVQDVGEMAHPIPAFEWSVASGQLGVAGLSPGSAVQTVAPEPNDVALILPTSGTTGQPKQVPLTHQKLLLSANNIADWLALDEDDISLTMMPLFHIHGLVAGLLAPLVRSGGVAVEPFNALTFGSYLRKHQPTWFSAVPTMHSMIIDRWAPRRDELQHRLRFVRSSSSALQPAVLKSIETLFDVPAAEAYGMTEAAHQISANPIGSGACRPGTVGVPTGTEVRIEQPDEFGRGEVLVRAPQVTDGYRNNESANASAFIDGWFRTGDQGVLSEDGWLTLTGRLKEMINRGGENISPIEVEECLAQMPGVQRCVVFAAPDQKLGESVMAAVVASEEIAFDESAIRQLLREDLAAHKVPNGFILVNEIPLGPTGKVQRAKVAEQLGIG